MILAGGASTRFGGRPKGLERVQGTRMIDRVAEALRAATPALLLVANDPGAEAWLPGVRVVRDLVPGAGPLAGIQAALHATGGDVLVVAWDMPFVPAALLDQLRSRGEASGAIVVPEGVAGRAEPVCAFYPLACRDALDAFLSRGERTPGRFLAEYPRVERLAPSVVATLGDPELLLRSINSPGELPGLGQ